MGTAISRLCLSLRVSSNVYLSSDRRPSGAALARRVNLLSCGTATRDLSWQTIHFQDCGTSHGPYFHLYALYFYGSEGSSLLSATSNLKDWPNDLNDQQEACSGWRYFAAGFFSHHLWKLCAGANGYFLEQFLQDISNKRTDEYGGSIENHMGMAGPLPTFSYLSQLAEPHPHLAYIHLVETRMTGNVTRDNDAIGAHESNDALRALWSPCPIIRAGGFSRASAIEAGESGDLFASGRRYISNRLAQNDALAGYVRLTFYLVGEKTPRGCTDYAFATATAAA
ncbi:hypothetical protein B0H19DRAFT_1364967 [Mycena capillaripes]|nr:hypothetical protein B0H19DRAFT_1364967 [Mycena capillaripes]